MITLKRDAEAIIAHIEKIKGQPWLTVAQRWWPGHLFHFTNITNAAQVLKDGVLLCRSELEKGERIITDIASPQIISSTKRCWKNYVRLYFRPRTPMQYDIEGFRPLNKRQLRAHCPVPVVFVFSAEPILTSETTLFSNGNLRKNEVKVGDSGDFFTSLPFEKIYHDTAFGPGSKETIIFHRHAEVIIPQSLDLSSLKLIYCRSQAEFETLFHLIPQKARNKWTKIIGAGVKGSLFFNRWPYVTKADLSTEQVTLTFNVSSEPPGPFHAEIEVKEIKTNARYGWNSHDFYARVPLKIHLSGMKHPECYVVSFFLDSELAYQSTYDSSSEAPF